MDIADEADRAHLHAYKGAAVNDHAADNDYIPAAEGGPTPMLVNGINAVRMAEQKSIIVRTPAQLKKLREEGRCFNCRERGHGGAQLSKRSRQNKSDLGLAT